MFRLQRHFLVKLRLLQNYSQVDGFNKLHLGRLVIPGGFRFPLEKAVYRFTPSTALCYY